VSGAPRATGAFNGDILRPGDPVYDRFVGKPDHATSTSRFHVLFLPDALDAGVCPCGRGQTIACGEWVQGHDQRAIHDRIRADFGRLGQQVHRLVRRQRTVRRYGSLTDGARPRHAGGHAPYRCPDNATALIIRRTTVTQMISPTAGLVPVHVGQPQPGSEAERLLSQQRRRTTERPLRVPAGLAWQEHGMDPRWLGMESSDCVVAVEPTIHGPGADEMERFLAGARRRDETALVIAVIGDVTDGSTGGAMSRFAGSVDVNKTFTRVSGRRLPSGTRPEIAPNLDPSDRDLAFRLLARAPEAPWWVLKLTGTAWERLDGSGSEVYEAEGELQPILVDALGDAVVAAWASPSGDQRWYVIPDATDWDTVLGWLVHRALPAHVPAALRRARSPHFVDPDLQTEDERAARQALTELEARYTEEKLHLEADLHRAQSAADPVRYGLLYGTGSELVAAVRTVLTAAGLTTIDLDEALGDTKSADLLVSAGTPGRLVEVKAAGGHAGEHLVGHLERHLTTWPQLCPDQPVAGGVLVVNHQHRLHPSERTARVYSRPEFLNALSVTVISTVELFNWWRTSDWTSIQAAVLDTEPPTGSTPSSPASPPTAPPGVPSGPIAPRPHAGRRMRWPWAPHQ